jgi:NAD(P)H-dependent flavin oxidoreductase YrpB (nitropropane dioxygenase family)
LPPRAPGPRARRRLPSPPDDLPGLLPRFREPFHVVLDAPRRLLGVGGTVSAPSSAPRGAFALVGTLPPLDPEWLGDRSFVGAHRLPFPSAVGEMAGGIASPRLVVVAARAGLLGFFGAPGLPLDQVEQAVDAIGAELGSANRPWGSNLIHSPQGPDLEEALADLYLRRGVRRVSASAFMSLSPAVVRYAYRGLRGGPDGRLVRPNHVFAKVSRPEVARHFLAPAPAPLLATLVPGGGLAADEARLAARVAVAETVTVEADSGGHTDNRPLVALFPAVAALWDELAARFRLARPVHVGAPGIGTPAAVAAAFALGAYVMTGSVNQAAVEAGTSEAVKALLAQADLADVAMAPAADMFELGVKVQVLKRGTCSPPGPTGSTRSTPGTAALRRCRARCFANWRRRSSAPPSARCGRAPARSGSSASPPRPSGPSATPGTAWPWCSAGSWATPAGGRARATPTGASTIRSGAGPPWAPSTAGPRARS